MNKVLHHAATHPSRMQQYVKAPTSNHVFIQHTPSSIATQTLKAHGHFLCAQAAMPAALLTITRQMELPGSWFETQTRVGFPKNLPFTCTASHPPQVSPALQGCSVTQMALPRLRQCKANQIV
jgi:hypothetical protein